MDAELQTFCKEHESILRRLMLANALDVRNGSSTLHFDMSGELRQIEIKAVVYKF